MIYLSPIQKEYAKAKWLDRWYVVNIISYLFLSVDMEILTP